MAEQLIFRKQAGSKCMLIACGVVFCITVYVISLPVAKHGIGYNIIHLVKPTVPTCDVLIGNLTDESAKYFLLAMYDPGTCSEIPNMSKPLFTSLPTYKEKEMMLSGHPVTELWKLCSDKNEGGALYRLCQGLPPGYRYHPLAVQKYEYETKKALALSELGEVCYHKKLAIFGYPNNLAHKGGPRKVFNNLMSGLRAIGKKYVFNPRDLESFDFLLSLDPHHGFFMYYMGESLAKRFYLGPTVIYYQFHLKRITEAVRNYSHIVSASKAALQTNQYFPHIPLDPNCAVIIPTGIDETIFSPENKNSTSEKDFFALSYVKHGCNEILLRNVSKVLKAHEVKIINVTYGTYTEYYFRTSLAKSRFAVVCDGTETQGIAMQEIMAMDVPLYVLNPNSVPYFSDQVGVVLKDNITVEESLSEFINNVKSRTFQPRRWLHDNLSLATAAINTMKVLCGLPNPWN